MIKYFIFKTILLLSFHPDLHDIPEEIVNAFRTGNAAQLARYFNQTIEFTMLDKEEIYSKTQAEIIMKDFFVNHPPTSFQMLHQGGKESSKYAIGLLTSGQNKYRITFLLKNIDSKTFIHQLRIEKDNT